MSVLSDAIALHYITLIYKLYHMNNKAQEPDKDDPFIIIHNFRKPEANVEA